MAVTFFIDGPTAAAFNARIAIRSQMQKRQKHGIATLSMSCKMNAAHIYAQISTKIHVVKPEIMQF